ncbi:MAG: hypothetical protein HY978_02275 [Candidatus Liptonbacteria bacterium]|nr:hypothetical protein [Candidatus Liptonbacteria bacterium]
MESLVHNLGLDWKLLLAQAVNFLIVLVVLRLTVYQPLLHLLRERRRRIEEGLTKAQEADRRLGEIGELQKEKLREAEQQGLSIIRNAETQAAARGDEILKAAAGREAEVMKRADGRAEAMAAETRSQLEGEAVGLVKRILTRVVEVDPQAVDDALIQKVARETRIHAD